MDAVVGERACAWSGARRGKPPATAPVTWTAPACDRARLASSYRATSTRGLPRRGARLAEHGQRPDESTVRVPCDTVESGAERRGALQVAIHRCRAASVASQDGVSARIEIDATTLERASGNAQVTGSLDAPAPERATRPSRQGWFVRVDPGVPAERRPPSADRRRAARRGFTARAAPRRRPRTTPSILGEPRRGVGLAAHDERGLRVRRADQPPAAVEARAHAVDVDDAAHRRIGAQPRGHRRDDRQLAIVGTVDAQLGRVDRDRQLGGELGERARAARQQLEQAARPT